MKTISLYSPRGTETISGEANLAVAAFLARRLVFDDELLFVHAHLFDLVFPWHVARFHHDREEIFVEQLVVHEFRPRPHDDADAEDFVEGFLVLEHEIGRVAWQLGVVLDEVALGVNLEGDFIFLLFAAHRRQRGEDEKKQRGERRNVGKT